MQETAHMKEEYYRFRQVAEVVSFTVATFSCSSEE